MFQDSFLVELDAFVDLDQRQEDAMVEHEQIVVCIKRRDPIGAEEALRRHLRNSYEHAIRYVISVHSG